MNIYKVQAFGATGDGRYNDGPSIQRAIDTCHANGGGQVLLPAGRTYLSGTIALKSHVELRIERGATLQASWNPADYDHALLSTALSGGQPDAFPAFAMITADRAENIAITGGGTIDGAGRYYVEEDLGYIYRMKQNRPFTFYLVGCRDITINDVTVRDGALWTIRLTGCEDAVIHSVRIQNDLKLPNNDGIDLDRCRYVRISDCHIVCGDDCITLKACQESEGMGACENITVTGCTLVSTSSALVVGCECRAPMRNVIFDSCVVQASHRGLAIHLSEECDVENVLFSNMIVETRLFYEGWWGRGEPIYVVALPWTAEHTVGNVRGVRFTNVLARSENGVVVVGTESRNIEELLFENVRVELDRWSRWPGGRLDLRPNPGEPMPESPTNGFLLKNARDVTVRNCCVVWGKNRAEDFRHALLAESVEGLTLEGFRGTSAQPDQYEAIVQR
jgi:hypothetical protein